MDHRREGMDGRKGKEVEWERERAGWMDARLRENKIDTIVVRIYVS